MKEIKFNIFYRAFLLLFAHNAYARMWRVFSRKVPRGIILVWMKNYGPSKLMNVKHVDVG